jgi:hypothetical protein
MHQFISAWGINWFAAICAALLGSFLGELFSLFGRPYSMHWLHWLLTETPYFPVDSSRTVLRMEALPSLRPSLDALGLDPSGLGTDLHCGCGSTLSPESRSVLTQTGGPLSHYFGGGCQPKYRCLDQLLVTLSFYSAAAYSIGAGLALRKARAPRD